MKKIGIVGWKIGDDAFGITLPYAEFLSKFGTIEIIMPTENIVRNIDLLVIPGGPDVDPARYLGNEPMSFYMGKQCPFRERFDNILLPMYIENKVPIFGICRGHQSLAVEFGGTLIQNMFHETNHANNRKELIHELKIETKELKNQFGINNVLPQMVNSIHHQTVDTKPNDALIIASYEDSIEALGYTTYPAFSVQWHPEEIYDALSISLINKLLE
jgi:gamma-glutamyl-gamma-aminobutyrate hydrolase PuuD